MTWLAELGPWAPWVLMYAAMGLWVASKVNDSLGRSFQRRAEAELRDADSQW